MRKILEILYKIYIEIRKKKNPLFKYSVKKQKRILNTFKNPQNNIERSYYQYCCQMKLNNRFIFFIMNILSIPLLIIYFFKKSDELKKEKKYDTIFMFKGMKDDIIPKKLKNNISSFLHIRDFKENFSKSDKKFFILLLKSYPFSWHFLLKCLIKIRFYSYIINSYTPNIIIVSSEYSFTSSMLTTYCNIKGINHINVMHGEKLFDITDSFFCFNKCYVWDEHYIKLFLELHAENTQFVVYHPKCLTLKKRGINKEKDYTYYLGGESRKNMLNIAKSLSILKNKGYKISIRPHPLYSNINDIEKIFKDFQIEDNNKIDIETSILRTNNVISLYSTVLYQAFLNEVPIVIDNISNKKYYEKLKELEFICLRKKHTLLSKVL